MKLSPVQRWVVLGVALAVTLIAARWAASNEEAVPLLAQSSQAPSPSEGQGGADTVPRLNLERLGRAPHNTPHADPFAQKRWTVATVPTPRAVAPPKPRPPQAPPLPFTYIGKAVERGQVTAFLINGENSYLARPGVTLDGKYRVERVDDRAVVFTYLPLGTRQELVLGPAK
jgi:hypothetical protein